MEDGGGSMTAKKGAGKPKEKPEQSFEDALSRLESIVTELEGKELTLEETLARYEEGSKLVQQCRKRLEAAEQRIRTISAESEKDGRSGEGEKDDKDDKESDLPF
jgi:exodeoxyribonuclease VII small subunit